MSSTAASGKITIIGTFARNGYAATAGEKSLRGIEPPAAGLPDIVALVVVVYARTSTDRLHGVEQDETVAPYLSAAFFGATSGLQAAEALEVSSTRLPEGVTEGVVEVPFVQPAKCMSLQASRL